jgi:hypothetical protein
MKKNQMLSVLILLTVCAGPVLSQGMVLTFGGSAWYTQPTYSGDYFTGLKSDPSVMLGPYLNLRLGDLVLGGSLYFGKSNMNYYNTETNEKSFDMGVSRGDMNLTLGISLVKNLTVFGAIKFLYSTGEKDFSSDGFPYKWKIEDTGVMFGGGLSAVVRVPNSPVFLFGSGALLIGTMSSTYSISYTGYDYYGDTYKETAKPTNVLISGNGGLGIQASPNISLLLGYRIDVRTFNLKETRDEYTDEVLTQASNGREIIHGPMATLAFSLR